MSKLRYGLKVGYYNFMGSIVYYNGGLKAEYVNEKGKIKARILEYTGKYLGKTLNKDKKKLKYWRTKEQKKWLDDNYEFIFDRKWGGYWRDKEGNTIARIDHYNHNKGLKIIWDKIKK